MNNPYRARALRNVFVVVYLGIQLVLPIRGYVQSKIETRANFSWNMYSQQYSARARYVLLTPDGRGVRIDHEKYAREPDRMRTVFRRDWLPKFHDWLTAELHREGLRGELRARVCCRHDFGPEVELIEPYSTVAWITDEGVRKP